MLANAVEKLERVHRLEASGEAPEVQAELTNAHQDAQSLLKLIQAGEGVKATIDAVCQGQHPLVALVDLAAGKDGVNTALAAIDVTTNWGEELARAAADGRLKFRLVGTEPELEIEPKTKVEPEPEVEPESEVESRKLEPTSFLLGRAAPAFSEQTIGLAARALTAGSDESASILQDLVWHLLADGHLPMARHLNRGYLETYPEGRSIPDALLSSLIVGLGLRQAAGPCKRYLEQSFYVLMLGDLDPGDEAWSRALRLLAASAGLCPAILAPGTNAPALLHDLDLTEWPHLDTLRATVVEFSELGYLAFDPNVIKTAAAQVDWSRHFDNLKEEVAQWLNQAPSVRTPFALANHVLRYWLRPNGELELLLRPIVEDSSGQAEEVRKQCKPWRHTANVQRKIREACAHLPVGLRTIRITGRALRRLQGLVREIVDFVDRWLDLLGKRPSRESQEQKRALTGRRSDRSLPRPSHRGAKASGSGDNDHSG